MTRILPLLVTSWLLPSAQAMDYALETNPILLAFSLQDEYTIANIAQTFQWDDRLSLSIPVGYEIVTESPEGSPVREENTTVNLNLRYHPSPDLYFGGVYRAVFKHRGYDDYQSEQLKQGVGFIVGQEKRFGPHWYLGYSFSGGLYFYNETHVLRDDRPDSEYPNFFGHFDALFDGIDEVADQVLLTVQFIQVGYRF